MIDFLLPVAKSLHGPPFSEWTFPLFQIFVSVLVFLEGYRVYRMRPENSFFRSFYALSLVAVLWMLFDSGASIIHLYQNSIASQLNRIAEVFFIMTIPFFHYFFPSFPPGGKKSRSRWGSADPARKYDRFLLIESIAFILAVWTLFGPGLPFAIARDSHATILINRFFLILIILLISFEIRQEYKRNKKDPGANRLVAMGDSLRNFFFAGILILTFHLFHRNSALTNAGFAFAVFLLLRFPAEIMTEKVPDYRKRLVRLLSALIATGMILPIPSYLLLAPPGSAARFGSTGELLIILLPALAVPLYSYVFRFFDSGFRTLDAASRAFIQLPLHPELLDSYTIRKGIYSLIQNLYSPDHLAMYMLVHEPGGKTGHHLILDADHIHYTTNLPPAPVFPEEVLQLFRKMDPSSSFYYGATPGELTWYAKRTSGENAVRQLRYLYQNGCDGIVVLRRKIDASGSSPSGNFENQTMITGILSIGKTSPDLASGIDLSPIIEKNDSLSSLILLDQFARKIEQLRNRFEEQQREKDLPQTDGTESLSSSTISFVYRPEGIMSEMIEQVKRFSKRTAPLLIHGETGTGKEQVARMIHELSGRKGSFVALNCSAIPDDLIENELFGHIRGAYTGADDETEGLVGRAENGTLFLDEIGEMPLEGQVKLLRLVQEGQYEKLGSSETKTTKARFVFATNRNLEEEVTGGNFRSDLYYRISTFEIQIPPLRERPEDIPLLVEHFLKLAGETFHRPGLRFTREAKEMLNKYRWPGNVRELENTVFRAVVLSESDLLDVNSLPEFFRGKDDFFQKRVQLEKIIQEQSILEKELLMEALEFSGNNQRKAAELLNMSRGALQYRMKQYGLTPD